MKILSTPDGPLSSGLAAREARGSGLGAREARGSGLARLGARDSGLGTRGSRGSGLGTRGSRGSLSFMTMGPVTMRGKRGKSASEVEASA